MNIPSLVMAHLGKWGKRLQCLREAKTDCLEAGIWISATVLFVLFAFGCSFGVIVYMGHLLPRWAWMVLTGVLATLSFVGYMEDIILMRRAAGLCSFFFWLTSGVLIFHLYPYAALLHLGQAALWSWVWTRVGQHDIKEKVAALPPAEVKSLAGQGSVNMVGGSRGRVVKMPRR